MMHAEIASKVEDGCAELVYLDEIEDLLESLEWMYLKILTLAMVPHTSRKYRATLDLSSPFL